VDNCSAHDPDVADKLQAIQLEFLPANTTSLLQPCDMGIIQNLKVHYRKRLLCKMIAAVEDENTAALSIDIFQATFWAREAWEDVTSVTIRNCFIKAEFTKNEAVAEPDNDTRAVSEFSEVFNRFCCVADMDENIEIV